MHMKTYFLFCFLLSCGCLCSQAQDTTSYTARLLKYQQRYIYTHEVVKKEDRPYFAFYQPDSSFRFECKILPINSNDTGIVALKTSANTTKYFKRYGRIRFTIHDTVCTLTLFSSLDPKVTANYPGLLFLPFTDGTTGDETYGSGRYIDLYLRDVKEGMITVDFNKAYNPYCAYATGFKCPVPPRENRLTAAVKAGEKTFAKPH